MAIREADLEQALRRIAFGGIADEAALRTWANGDATCERQASLDTHGCQLVRAMIGMLSELALEPRVINRIAEVDISVVRADVINACAVSTDEGPKIVIFTGLIKALMYVLELNEAVAIVNRKWRELLHQSGLSEQEFNSEAYQSFTLLGHYAIWRTPLLRAYPKIGRSERGALVLQLAKVLLFLVTHELAHIELGHLENATTTDGGPLVLPALAIDEATNELKTREFEADGYIVDCLLPSQKYTFLSWALLPLQTFCSLERLLSNYRDTHPMAINRLQNLRRRAEDIGAESFAGHVEDIVAGQKRAQQAYMSSRRNSAFHSSVETGRTALLRLRKHADFAIFMDHERQETRAARHADVWDALMGHFNADETLDE